mmetsp:Transcript_20160/g.52444  ORF Transcript_20160/g.52444 Transcript_20160/m.52444 type:complete len:276 (+) Transcript_20160:1925-2752(+)
MRTWRYMFSYASCCHLTCSCLDSCTQCAPGAAVAAAGEVRWCESSLAVPTAEPSRRAATCAWSSTALSRSWRRHLISRSSSADRGSISAPQSANAPSCAARAVLSAAAAAAAGLSGLLVSPASTFGPPALCRLPTTMASCTTSSSRARHSCCTRSCSRCVLTRASLLLLLGAAAVAVLAALWASPVLVAVRGCVLVELALDLWVGGVFWNRKSPSGDMEFALRAVCRMWEVKENAARFLTAMALYMYSAWVVGCLGDRALAHATAPRLPQAGPSG